MSIEIRKELCIKELSLADIESKISLLENQGVVATNIVSGELNMSGCASGYCMAWA